MTVGDLGNDDKIMIVMMMMIYIMMQCLFACNEKSSLPTSELSAGGAK